MPTPSQARIREGVETLQAAPKAKAKVKTKSRPRTERAAKAEVVSQGRNAGALPARGIFSKGALIWIFASFPIHISTIFY